jgi:hypothetical protein
MNLTEMKTIVRRDLHDEDSQNYRWTDDELERHIARAVKEFSGAFPYEQKAVTSTTVGSREIDISSITERVSVEAVEYPVGNYPPPYQRFSQWGDILTIHSDEVPDGSDVYIYYGKLHTLDYSTSTIPAVNEDLVAAGASGFAAVEWAIYAVNRVNTGGVNTPEEFLTWGRKKLSYFRRELKKLGNKNRVRISSLYRPYNPPVSQSTDYGP